MTQFRNTPFDQLEIGMQASSTRLCTADELYVFANASGNLNPLHLQDDDGWDALEPVAPAMWLGALISAVLGNRLPGPGTLYRSQTLRFLDHAKAGDELTATVRLDAKGADGSATFATWVERADGLRICEGTAEVIPPTTAQSFDASDVPGLTLQRHVHFDRLIERASMLEALPTAVAAPETADALAGAVLGAEHGMIRPILIGDSAKIQAAAKEAGVDITGFELVHELSHDAAAARAVAMVHDGRAKAVMKGHLHTDQLLRHIIKRDGGLRTNRRLSHVFVMDVPGLNHLLLISDAAINITPSLEEKVDIVQNAINLALALGIETPRAGILSAIETVNPKIPSTLDAAALSKMADRGQITGGAVDGPLAMDNAINLEAARTKGIKSMVAGQADILIAPNLESANMIAKELTFLAHAEAGGLVVGAQCPVILTSRADDDKARLASCAVAALYAAWRAKR